MKIQNPHDKYFKETFGRVTVAKDFLYNYLPQSVQNIINIDTLEPQKDSFINEELRESFSDLLFKTSINQREGYLYFLFEHKSGPSWDTAVQMLRYMAEIWNTKISKEKAYELPVIIPLVVYHGEKSWGTKTTLSEMIQGYEQLPGDVRAHVPDYKYLLYDLSGYTDEEIKGHVLTQIAMMIMRDMQKKDLNKILESFYRAAMCLRGYEDKQTGIKYYEISLLYLLSVRTDLTKSDFNGLIKNIETTYPEGSEVAMTLAEVFREEGMERGMEEGMEKGMEIGAKKGKLEVARNAIKEGMDFGLIVKLTGLPKREIERIAKELDN